jgi:hypothetical protein
MRKLKTQNEVDKERKRNITIISVVLLGLMVFSTAGFAFLSGGGIGSEVNENTDIGSSNLGGNVFEVNGEKIVFSFSPQETLEVPIEMNKSYADYQEVLYIVSEDDRVTQELSFTLGRFVSRVQEACLGECEKDLPEKTCEENLVVFEKSEENRVYQEDECVIIQGNLRAVDAFVYKILGAI